MFTPVELELDRGWPGKIDGDRVIQVAAQTLQAFFTGGGTAREHAEYPLADVRFRAPVLHPPSIRIFENEDRFEFANPAAIKNPDATIAAPGEGSAHARVCGVIGSDEQLAGYTLMADVRALLDPPKDRDFALGLGPSLVTLDEAPPTGFDWETARRVAAWNTRLVPGDLLAAPIHETRDFLHPGETIEFELEPIGVLRLNITV
jgi:hypothetical protein